MSYANDLAALVRLEKLRLVTLVVAFGMSLLSILFDAPWLLWPRAVAWAAGALCCVREARVEKRLGRDPDGSYLRALMFGLVAAMCIVLALRS